MADFTVEGIIEVDASRAIHDVTKFQNKLKMLMRDLTKVDREIKKLSKTRINIEVELNRKAVDEFRADIERMRRTKPIKINTNLDAAKTRSEFSALITQLRARKAVSIKVEPDFNNLKTEFAAQIKRMRGTSSIKVPVDVNGARARRQLKDLIKELKAIAETSGPIKIKVDIDSGAAMARAAALRAQLEAIARNRTRAEVKVDVDKSALDKFAKVFAGTSGILQGVGAIGLMASAITALVAAAGPLITILGAGAGGLLGAIGVLGTGIGAFAAFAIPTFKDFAGAVKLVNTNVNGMSDAKLKAFSTQLAKLKEHNPELYALALAFNNLKKEYMGFVKELRPHVLVIMAKGFQALNSIMKLVFPIAMQAAKGISTVMDHLNKNLRSNDVRAFFKYVHDNIASFVIIWSDAIGNFLVGILNMIRAFDPFTKMFNGGLLKMSQNFRNWSAGLDKDKGFQNFVTYVKQNWPAVKKAFGEFFVASFNILKALAPLGIQVLNFIGSITGIYNAFKKAHPQLASWITSTVALTLILSPLIGLLGSVGGAIAGIVGAIGGVGAAIAGVVALAAAIAASNRKTRSWKSMLDSFKGTWKDIQDGVKGIIGAAKLFWTVLGKTDAANQFQATFKNISDMIGDLMPVLKILAYVFAIVLVGAINALAFTLRAFTGILGGLVAIVSKVVQAIAWPFEWLYDHLVGHSVVPDMINGIISWFMKLPSIIPGIVWSMITKVGSFFVNMYAKELSIMGKLVSGVVSKAGALVSGAVGAIRGLPGQVAGYFSSLYSSVTGKAEALRSTVVHKFAGIVTGATTYLSGIKGHITGFFADAGSWLADAGMNLMKGLGSSISSGFDKYVKNPIHSVAGAIGGLFGGSPVEYGPLLPWNHGAPGKQLMKFLSEGIQTGSKNPIDAAASVAKQIAATQFQMSGTIRNSGIGDSMMGGLPGSNITQVNNTYQIDMKVPVGASSVEIGRTLTKHIDAYEQAGGRRKVTK